MTRFSFCFAVCVRARSFLLIIICRLLGAVRPGVSARAAARSAQQRRRNPDRRCQVLHGPPPPTIPVGSCCSFLARAAYFDVHSRRGIRYRQTELADRFSCRDRLFLSFPYVCPEPVLVKSPFLYINGKKTEQKTQTLACLLRCCTGHTYTYIYAVYLRGSCLRGTFT